MSISDRQGIQFLKDDYVRDLKGIIYLVIMNDHPPKSVVVVPKYIPTVGGKWKGSYSRLFVDYTSEEFHSVMKSEKFQKNRYYSREFQKELIFLPHKEIDEHFVPENKLKELMYLPRKELSFLRKKAVDLAKILLDIGIERTSIGITGSILYNLDMPFSNLSMILYGYNAVKNYLNHIEDVVENNSNLDLKKQSLELNNKQIDVSSRIRTFLWINGISAAIHVNEFPDFKLEYGYEFAQNLGKCDITAKIYKVESGFVRKTYRISPVEIISWPSVEMKVSKTLQLKIFSGRSKDIIFREGELIRACGYLQKVENRDKKSNLSFLRVTIGLEENPGFVCPFSLLQNIQ